MSTTEPPHMTRSKPEDCKYFTNTHVNARLVRYLGTTALCTLEQLNAHVPSAPADESIFAPPTGDEIRLKLCATANSAPGQDRVEYRHLRLVDKTCQILASIFARCFAEKDMPDPWKTATTILIHKKGPTEDVSNFRPIALMSCIYKLMMAILARRISKWSIDNDLLSPEQKSARPSEGCYEHGFLLHSLVGDARRHQKKLFLSWLDLRNAFGSVTHDAVFTTLEHMGFPPAMIQLIQNAYTNATTTIRTGACLTSAIPIHARVKQGCPLSPIVFNLTLELVLRKVKNAATQCPRGPARHHDTPLSVLAYADDLVLIARRKDSLATLLEAASSAANIIGLEFRPDKCASLSIDKDNGGHLVVHQNAFQVQRQPIPPLAAEEHYRYLGIPIGLVHIIDNLPELVDRLIPELQKIEASLLAPWQKLAAIRTFIQPSLTYALRAGSPKKQSLDAYRSTLTCVVCKICDLPTRSASSYMFASRRAGRLGLQDPVQD